MIINDVYCNNCEIRKSHPDSEWFHYENTWGYYGVEDSRHDVIDLCHLCYTETVNKFKIHPEVNQ